MRRAACILIVGVQLALLLVLPGVAGAAEPLEVVSWQADDHPSVQLTVSVPSDLAGVDLDADDFSLAEGGEPRDLQVSRLSNENLQVVLLLDASNSMSGAPLAAVKAAAEDFVTSMPAGAETAVVSFATRAKLLSSFSSDPATSADAIRSITARGRTSLHDAVGVAVEQFSDQPPGRRVVVLIADGEDNQSTTTVKEAGAALAAADVSLVAVELETQFSDGTALRRLAAPVNGQVVPAEQPESVAAVYEEIATNLVNQYELSYQSEASGPTKITTVLQHGAVRAEDTRVLPLPEANTPAESPPAATSTLQIVGVDTSTYPRVAVTVVAPRALADAELDAEAFRLVESGEARDISVRRADGEELAAVLVLDTSGSMDGAMAAARAAAVEFVEQLPPGARVALVGFADQPQRLAGFTSDKARVIEAIGAARVGGETALYDAVLAATAMFSPSDSARSIVLLSDGGDTASTATLEAAVRRLADSDAALHAISLVTDETDEAALERLTAATDGFVASATDAAALTELFAQIATDVGNQYVIEYETTARGLVELGVGITAEGVVAESSKGVDLPPPPSAVSFMGSRSGLVLGALLCYVAFALVILILLAPRQKKVRLTHGRATRSLSDGPNIGGVSELAEWASAAAERTLHRRGKDRSLNLALERAGVDLRPGEFVVLMACVAAVTAAVVFVLASPMASVFGFFFAVLASRKALSWLTGRRQAAFADQLSDTLQLMAGSLRAGYSLLQAVDAVAKEAESPTRDEFQRLLVENRLGRDLHETLAAMAERTGSEDFRWIIEAIEIHREVGGNLADVLDKVSATIRERNRIKGQIKTLSAEGRISVYILLALPVVLATGMHLINPTYLPIMFSSGIGQAMLVVAAMMMAIGTVWMRKLVRLVF